jgi:integrase
MEKNFEQLYLEHCPDHAFLLTRLQEALNVDEVTFADITTINLTTFKDYLKSYRKANGKLIAASTVKNYLAVFGAFVNDLAADGLIQPVNMKKVGHIKVPPSENVYCTEEEMARIDAYYDRLLCKPNHQAEKDVLTLFLIESVTGARQSDCALMTERNIQDGQLSYISKKTKQKAVMPIHRKLQKYLAHRPTREYSRTTIARIIKRVAERCGITEQVTIQYRGELRTGRKCDFMSSHSGRRSFITNLINLDVPIAAVSKMAGHASVVQTQRYYVGNGYKLSDNAMGFFGG